MKKKNLPKDKFAVFGSGPMAIRGIREADDLDIIVTKDLWDELKARHGSGRYAVQFDGIEAITDWPPFDDAKQVIDDAEIVDGIRFAKLKHVLVWKKCWNREKDQKDLTLIEEYLKCGKK